jgi:D-alanyl-D-alanine carboxypeptidase
MTSPLASLHAVAIVATLTSALPAGISDAAGPVDERAAALDKAIPLAMQRASIPGAIVGIWPDGSESYVRAFGLRDTATGEKMAPDLYMRIGSNSKTFTVTALLMLADQGKLGLDDPISRYVGGVPGGDQITLRQLAEMRSGLYNYADDTNPKMPQQPLSGNGHRTSWWRSPSAMSRCFRRAAHSTIATPTRCSSALWSRKCRASRSRPSSSSIF